MKEWEMLGYKKRAPRLDVGQKLDAIFKAVKEVAKWTLGEFLYHVFKLKNAQNFSARPLTLPWYLNFSKDRLLTAPQTFWMCGSRIQMDVFRQSPRGQNQLILPINLSAQLAL